MMSDSNPYAAPQSEIVEAITGDSTIPGPHNYATRWQRFFGSLIDGLLIIVPFFILLFSIGFFGVVYQDEAVPDNWFWNNMMEETFLWDLVATLAVFAVTIAIQGYFWHTRSQSIGKIVVKTKIVTLDGRDANFNNIAFRRTFIIQILGMVPGIGNLIGFIDAVMIFRKDYNCLHDDIAGTRVIRVDPQITSQI